MDEQFFWIFLIFIGGGALFSAGVLFHKYVVSEAASIKAHMTAEITAARAEVSSLLSKATGKL